MQSHVLWRPTADNSGDKHAIKINQAQIVRDANFRNRVIPSLASRSRDEAARRLSVCICAFSLRDIVSTTFVITENVCANVSISACVRNFVQPPSLTSFSINYRGTFQLARIPMSDQISLRLDITLTCSTSKKWET